MPNPLDYNRAKPLFMLPDNLLAIDDAPNALESLYNQGKPVLIYLHGRAKGIGEPRKSVEEKYTLTLPNMVSPRSALPGIRMIPVTTKAGRLRPLMISPGF